jgi:hypothetical protein
MPRQGTYNGTRTRKPWVEGELGEAPLANRKSTQSELPLMVALCSGLMPTHGTSAWHTRAHAHARERERERGAHGEHIITSVVSAVDVGASFDQSLYEFQVPSVRRWTSTKWRVSVAVTVCLPPQEWW